jgi:hypothetical protein
LETELPKIIIRSLNAYERALTAHKTELFYDWCPRYFQETQDDLRKERNPLYNFLKSEQVTYEEGCKTSMEQIRSAFGRFIGKPVSTKLDRGTFEQADERYIVTVANICKHSESGAKKVLRTVEERGSNKRERGRKLTNDRIERPATTGSFCSVLLCFALFFCR